MKIQLGSGSSQKLELVKKYFDNKNIEAEVVLLPTVSGVPQQPLTKEETIQGAVNRAVNVFNNNNNNQPKFDISLGLEGGLFLQGDDYHLVCAAALVVSKENVYIGVAQGPALPQDVSQGVSTGGEFGFLIRKYEKEITILNKASRQIISELVNRSDCFSQALELAFQKYKNDLFAGH